MDFFELSSFFGGSLFADDYRGNFEQIGASLRQDDTNGGHIGSHRSGPGFLLKKAVFWTLSGNHAKARQWLERLRNRGNSDHEHKEHRRKCYELLSLVDRLHPPAIRFRSQFGGSAAVIFEAQNYALLSELRSFNPRHDTLNQLEFSIPLRIYQYNIFLWMMQAQHPQYGRPEFAIGGLDISCRSNVGPFPAGFIESARRLQMETTAGSMKRFAYEAEVARFPVLQSGPVEDLSRLFEDSQDLVGQALCHLSNADKLSSPSFTSPLALNFVVEGKLSGITDDVWDLEEPKFALRASARAETSYQSAFHLMEAAGSARGCSAVLLRQAAILHMEALHHNQSRKMHAVRQLDRASSKIEAALVGFKGDEANTCLVNCHHILLDISLRHLDPTRESDALTVEERAAEIGVWGKRADNLVLSQFCGLMMLRFGRRMMLDHEYLDVAVLCTYCAKAIFKESDDKIFLLQALLAEADLVHSSGNFAQAELVLRDARASLEPVLGLLQELGRTSTAIGHSLKGPSANLLLSYDRIASKVLMSAADSNALKEWRQDHSRIELEQFADGFFARPEDLSLQPRVDGSSSPESSTFDMKHLLEELNELRRLGEVYNAKIDVANAELDRGNIDGYDAQLVEFLTSTESMKAPKDQTATFRIIAYSSLGFPNEAARILPLAIPRFFERDETSIIDSSLRRVFYQGINVNMSPQIDRNQAERGISLCFLSQDWTTGLRLLSSVAESAPGYLNIHNPTVRGYDWKLDSWIGAIYEHNSNFDEAFRWYLRALHIMETFRSRNADAVGRSGFQSSIHGSELFSGLIRISLSYASQTLYPYVPNKWGLPADNWTDQALMFMEQSSARTLLEFIVSQPELIKQGADQFKQWAEYTYIKRQIADLSTVPVQRVPESERGSIETELTRLKEELARIERDKTTTIQFPRTAQALLRASRFNIHIESLVTAIPHNAAVIEINMSRSGIVVLCITRTGIQKVYQSTTTVIQMRRYILKYLEEVSDYQKALSSSPSRLIALTAMPTLSSVEELNAKADRISEHIIAPFSSIIAQKDHVIFVPSQEFNIFPLSALVYAGQPLFIFKAVSQVPGLATLDHLMSRPQSRKPLVVSTIFNTHKRTSDAPGEAPAPTPMTGVSALLTSQLFGSQPMPSSSLTEDTFRSSYEQSDIVVMSTHGYKSRFSPWQSYIKLARDFRVIELSQFRSNAALVIFGACLSGTGRVTAGNDVHGFSHAVLQSGAQTYMGALWKVSDYVTMLLLLKFFRSLADSRLNISIAGCWQNAQKSIYALDNTTAADMLEEIQHELSSPDVCDVSLEHVRKIGTQQLRRIIKDLRDGLLKTNFKHPYYWAPFGLVGFGGLCLSTDELSKV